MFQVFSDVQTIGAGANYDIQPPVGQDWLVTDIGCNTWAGVAPLGVPSLDVFLRTGAVNAMMLSTANDRGWGIQKQFHINNTVFVRINNPALGGVNASFSAILSRDYGTGASSVISNVIALGAGVAYAVQPPVGQEWLLNDFGSSVWLGAAPAAIPDMTVDIFDGTIAAAVMNATNIRGWYHNISIYANNTDYVQITNTAGAGANLGFSGVLARSFGTGISTVVTNVVTVGAGGVATIRPPVGEEWKINEIGASVWVGIAPLQFPNVQVDITDGTIAGMIARAADAKNWMHPFEIFIDRNNWLTITDTGGAGGNIGYSAVKTVQMQ